ncbi:ATP-grasp fold amidoligase family protein [Microvirga pudoricolor]|uniref:ATP-grasp fold amidoligase family protein n=1 Tax=Microvirga pudoricolor TaxID=2778729 RepID=UPI001950F116|nr:ATP-grasp fold amidoligase family protein [Microvirga pudoricolor]MBM6596775.1 hypothetical protein [Microvirga pudoricolor]
MLHIPSIKQSVWNLLPDKLAVQLQYFRAHGRLPNLTLPMTFTEKVQHRKLYDRDPRLPVFADKAKVKHLVSAMVGSQYVIPTLWTGRDIDDLDFDSFKRPFVIKPTHSCGETIFVRDGESMDWASVRSQCRSWLKNVYGTRTREWLYERIEPAIMIESMIGDGTVAPADYKFFVFHGAVQLIQVDVERFGDGRERAIYDPNWRRLQVRSSFPDTPQRIDRPSRLDEMKRIVEAIGSSFTFVRVDLYEVHERVYFGETTFYPASGYARYHPASFDAELGAHWSLQKGIASPARTVA